MSSGYQPGLQERLPARPPSIAELRHAVVAYAGHNGASDRQLEEIALAVSEAVSNAVLHAYVGYDAPGAVEVSAWIDERALQVLVCDEGRGMSPRTDSPGLGLGLGLMRRATEQIRFESHGVAPGMRVLMTFAIN